MGLHFISKKSRSFQGVEISVLLTEATVEYILKIKNNYCGICTSVVA